MPDVFEILINKIVALLNKDAKHISDVLTLLNSHERAKLLSKFDSLPESEIDFSKAGLELKSDILNSLILALLSKPQLQKGDKGVIQDLQTLSFEVYTAMFSCLDEQDIKKIETLVLLTLFGVSGDKTPEVAILVERNQELFTKFSPPNAIVGMRVKTYHLLTMLFGKLTSAEHLAAIDRLETQLDENISTIQHTELQKESLDIQNGLELGALANLIHITKSVKKYLFEGGTGESENIYSLIRTYVFNAVQLAENSNDETLARIITHCKGALDQLCANSIWAVANQSPLIKKYFEDNLKSQNNVVLTLMPSQRKSLLQILSAKKSVVINMPTSSGKSLLAELYILYTIHNRTYGDFKPTIAYVVPTNALINQVKAKLKKVYETFNYKIESLVPFYDEDSVEEEILKQYGHVDILVTTPEKMDFMVRNDNFAIKNLSLLIVDEAHNISDENRGSKFELLLAVIKQRRNDVNFLLLSPFIKNSGTLAEWLGDTEQNSSPVTIQWAPTKQYVGCNIIGKDKTSSNIIYCKTPRNNIVDQEMSIPLNVNLQSIKEELKENKISSIVKNIALLSKYLKLGGTVLVLSKGAGSAQDAALKATKYFVSKNKLADIGDNEAIKRTLTIIRYESGEADPLLSCLKYGVAYHHAQMNGIVKEQIELLALKGLIKIMFATTTLAQGMNFPITTVIFDTLILGGKEIPRTTFWNVAGRAGRAFMDSEGHIIVGFNNSAKETKESLINYIRHDTEEIVSSLTHFFESIEGTIKFDYKLVKDHPAVSNFLQYLNHIVKVAYEYRLNEIDTNKIRSILNTSLFYKEGEFKQGFIETQRKINSFAMQYVQHLKGENVGQLTLADTFGVSDLSLNLVTGLILEREREIKLQTSDPKSQENQLLASKIILETKDIDNLAEIVGIIAKFPEMQISLWNQPGKLDAVSVAKVIIGWVNGQSIHNIAQSLEMGNKDVLGICNQYINSNLKNFIPWGINVYQMITKDKTDTAKMLPSYIYYGVNDKESVILSRIGVPRFLVNNVKTILKKSFANERIATDNLDNLRARIKEINDFAIGSSQQEKAAIKEIVMNYV